MEVRTPIAIEVRLPEEKYISEPATLVYDLKRSAASITSITGEAVRAATSSTPPEPPIRVFVDRARRDSVGDLSILGWVVARSRMVTVQVHLDKGKLGVARIGLPREDVQRAHPVYLEAARSGFAFAERRSRGRPNERVVLQAIAEGGVALETVVTVDEPPTSSTPIEAEADSSSPTTQARAVSQPLGPTLGSGPPVKLHCDLATLSASGILTVSGWAVCAAGVTEVSLFLDDTHLGDADLGHPREDVGRQFPGIPLARRSGFQLKVERVVPKGANCSVRLVARSALGRTQALMQQLCAVEEAPQAISLDQTSPAPSTGVRSELDLPHVVNAAASKPIVGRLTISGWAVAQAGIEFDHRAHRRSAGR